jgi:Xaa-Pro aminopeptidase
VQSSFFRANRAALLARLQEHTKAEAGVVVLAAYTAVQQSHDAAAPFVQEANFWYLTGIEEPGWRLIIDASTQKSWLSAPTKSDVHTLFDGGISAQQAQAVSGVDEVLQWAEAEALVAELASHTLTVATLGTEPGAEYYDFTLNNGPLELLANVTQQFKTTYDCRRDLAQLRAIKQPEEIAEIRAAVAVTIEAFEMVKSKIHTYSHEYQVEADFSHHFRWFGAPGHAYEPIVAFGAHACTLHYNQNNASLTQGGFLLLDVGARRNGYAADITRTYAVGVVSERHQAVHAAVQTAHYKIISLLKPGLNVRTYHQEVDEIMKSALQSLGLLKTPDDYRKYFPHAISHGLGLDVHDSLGAPKEFAEGMVLTVEPGIYIPEENIGVRIEDDILITRSGYENLSAGLSTEP